MSANKETNENKFFTYKGYPLVRKGNELCYGNSGDDYIIQLTINKSDDFMDIKTATNVTVIKMSTDESRDFFDRIEKTAEKNSLFSALDLAYAWLTV